MKVGDLVTFQSSFWSVVAEYANPGLILEKDDSHRQVVYKVMWADKKITSEHHGLLKKISLEINDETPE